MRFTRFKNYPLFTFFFLLSFLPITQTFAQQPTRIHDKNTNAWLMYFGNNQLSKKWGLHTEVQIRRADVVKDWQQLLLRTGVNYNLSDKAMFTLGYGFIKTHPYGDYPATDDFPEHRAFQQLLLKQTEGIFALQHRYRLEQRWVQPPGSDESVYTNRFRYLLRANIPLQGKTIDDKELYLGLYDEVMISFGKNVRQNIFDQNRAYAALGFKLNKAASVEAGYLHQLVQKANGVVFEHNNTLQLALFYNLNFTKPAPVTEPAP